MPDIGDVRQHPPDSDNDQIFDGAKWIPATRNNDRVVRAAMDAGLNVVEGSTAKASVPLQQENLPIWWTPNMNEWLRRQRITFDDILAKSTDDDGVFDTVLYNRQVDSVKAAAIRDAPDSVLEEAGLAAEVSTKGVSEVKAQALIDAYPERNLRLDPFIDGSYGVTPITKDPVVTDFTKEEGEAELRPGERLVRNRNNPTRFIIENDPNVFTSRADAKASAHTGQVQEEQPDGSFRNVDGPTKPLNMQEQAAEAWRNGDTAEYNRIMTAINTGRSIGLPKDAPPPLKFNTEAQAIAQQQLLGAGYEINTRGGFWWVDQVDEAPESGGILSEIDKAMGEAFVAGDNHRVLSLDQFRDSLTQQRGFSASQAFSIAQQFAESQEEWDKIFEELTNFGRQADVELAATARPDQGATPFQTPTSIRTQTNVDAFAAGPDGFTSAAPPPTPLVGDFGGDAAVPIPLVGDFGGDATEAAIAAATEANRQNFFAALEEGQDPLEASLEFGIGGPNARAIAGFGPNAELGQVRLLRALQQGATIEDFSQVPPTVRGSGVPGFKTAPFGGVVDASGLSAAEKTRFFQSTISDDELLQTLSGDLTQEDVQGLLSGGPVSGSSGPAATGVDIHGNPVTGGSFRNGVSTENRPGAGTQQFTNTNEQLSSRYGFSSQEIDQMRANAKKRRDDAQSMAASPGAGQSRTGAFTTSFVNTPINQARPRVTRFG
jgi:hypothetical protein